jgi:hypothetical protein
MDPITIIGAIASCAQLTGTTAQLGLQLYRFYCDVRNAPAKSKELCDEVSELSYVIEELSRTLKAVEQQCSVVNNVISADSLNKYSEFLKDFSSRIHVNKNDIKKKLKWPLSIKDNEELLVKIERHKATFTLALQSAGLKVDIAHTYFSLIYTNNGRIQLEQINDGVANITLDLKRQGDAANRQLVNAKQQKIVDWLKICDPSTNHNAARNAHEPETGSWFINSSEFFKWRDNEFRSLWLQGIPGAGKTILCSTVIDEIQKYCITRPEYQSAYFYFDFNDNKKQVIDSFLRSVIIQLFVYRQDIPVDVQLLYDSCHGNQPTRNALITTLLSLVKTSGPTYILIDALDECCERDKMIDLLKHLILSSYSLNILVTSRKEQDIITDLQCHIDIVISIQSAKVDADVDLYIRKCLDSDARLRRCLPIREDVIKALVKGVNGMYFT